MFNEESVAKDHTCALEKRFLSPDYNGFCFSNISPTIEKILTGNSPRSGLPASTLPNDLSQIKNVVILFVDSFGWRFLDLFRKKFECMQSFDVGIWSKLTSQFPSTTAAHVTNLHTGLQPNESGVFEWFYYEPEVDEVIAPLLFASVTHGELPVSRDSLESLGVNPKDILPVSAVYERLQAEGIKSYIYGHKNYTPSRYGDAVMCGVNEFVPFEKAEVGLDELLANLRKEDGKTLHTYYIDAFDAACHEYGPESAEAIAEGGRVFELLVNKFLKQGTFGSGDTLVTLIADHGHSQLTPSRTIFLDEKFPELLEKLEHTKNGKPIAPCGSCRDLFLHVKEEFLEETFTLLEAELKEQARVVYTSYLHDNNFFGSNASSKEFRAKTGNLAVLPFDGESIWFSLGGAHKSAFLGQHGGLTPNEMEVAFWSCLAGF